MLCSSVALGSNASYYNKVSDVQVPISDPLFHVLNVPVGKAKNFSYVEFLNKKINSIHSKVTRTYIWEDRLSIEKEYKPKLFLIGIKFRF